MFFSLFFSLFFSDVIVSCYSFAPLAAMYPRGKEFCYYIKPASGPTLNRFAEEHFDLMDDEDCTLCELTNRWVLTRTERAKSHRLRYQYLEKKTKELKKHIDALKSISGDDTSRALDKLSLRILEMYNDLTPLKEEVLKLSSSRIVDLIDADFEDYFKQHIPTYSKLGAEEETKAKETSQDFIQCVNTSFSAARKHVFLQRADLEEEGFLEAEAYRIIDSNKLYFEIHL
ncbi:hypothetical protein EDC96DRAFT_569666 [Choanephora cucurbitarum]|nr:hypothetical protein EDC96DRAFT_569666 [Choanephora cucurbitarum]